MPPAYHDWAGWRKRNFKVAHYPFLFFLLPALLFRMAPPAATALIRRRDGHEDACFEKAFIRPQPGAEGHASALTNERR